jgi:hypothetical protein
VRLRGRVSMRAGVARQDALSLMLIEWLPSAWFQ